MKLSLLEKGGRGGLTLNQILGTLYEFTCKTGHFDWDGTLFDSVGRSYRACSLRTTVSATDADAKSIIGLGLPEVAQLFPTVPELHADILQAYSDHYVANSVEDAWFDGVSEMLYALKDEG